MLLPTTNRLNNMHKVVNWSDLVAGDGDLAEGLDICSLLNESLLQFKQPTDSYFP